MFRDLVDYHYHWSKLSFFLEFLESEGTITLETKSILYNSIEQLLDLTSYSKIKILDSDDNLLNVCIDGVKYRFKSNDLPGHVLVSSDFMELFTEDKHTIEKIENEAKEV